MKIVFSFLILFSISYSYESKELLDYAEKYTKSNHRSIYKLVYDLVNSSIDFSKIDKWERQKYIPINRKELNEAIDEGVEFDYVMSLMNNSDRFNRLRKTLKAYYDREEEFRRFQPKLYGEYNFNLTEEFPVPLGRG